MRGRCGERRTISGLAALPGNVRPDRFVLDRHGRWLTGLMGPPYFSDHVDRTSVVVWSLATGRVVLHREFPFLWLGVTASADGTRLLGLKRLGADASKQESAVPADAPDGHDLVTLALPDEVLEAPGLAAPSRPSAGPVCPLPDVDAAVRSVKRIGGTPTIAWEVTLAPGHLEAPRTAITRQASPPVFVDRGGDVWLDRGDDIALLDAATGTPGAARPTRRTAGRVVAPSGATAGFVAGQGDTLAWRALDDLTGATRRVIDVRSGWRVRAVETIGRVAVVEWSGTSVRPAPVREGEGPVDAFVIYDVASGRRLSESEDVADEDAMGEREAYSAFDVFRHSAFVATAPACRDEGGPILAGFDWRVSVAGSIRAFRCGPHEGDAATVLWSNLDLQPGERPSLFWPLYGADVVGPIAMDGALAVFRDAQRLQVFDAARRAELAVLDISTASGPGQETFDEAWISARRKLLLVRTDSSGKPPVLRAYRLP
jgi:hypothetical protein